MMKTFASENVPSISRPVDWLRLTIAVLVPCYNEILTIGSGVSKFRKALPTATIYVCDNNATDGSIEIAEAAGAVVRAEQRQGTGFVVRRMFADTDGYIYALILSFAHALDHLLNRCVGKSVHVVLRRRA